MAHEKGKRLKKTTIKQYEEMLHFIQNNKIIIRGKTKPLEANKINRLWEEFADTVNCMGHGPAKTAQQWQKIFNEWKVNTRRKSREIKLNIRCTGGGPATKKKLTDLEEQLLSLLSKIHLGDESLPDSMQTAAESFNLKSFDTYDVNSEADVVLQDQNTNSGEEYSKEVKSSVIEKFQDSSALYSSLHEENYESIADDICIVPLTKEVPSTSKETRHARKTNEAPELEEEEADGNFTKTEYIPKKYRKVGQRYTNSILESACQSYNEAQRIRTDNDTKKAEAINNLTKAIMDFTEVYKGKVEAEKIRAQAEMIKAKIEYYKTFGNMDCFNDL